MTEEVDRILKTARSVRRRLDFDRPVERSVLLSAIEVAVQAPVGTIGENWRFMVITEPGLKAEIARHYGEILDEFATARGIPIKGTQQSLRDNMHRMPALILVYAIGEPPAEVSGQIGFFGSILPAAWSLMLALRARDLGTTWTSLLSARSKEIGELLGVPDGVTQTVMLPLAYTKNANLKPADRLSAEEVTLWNGWSE